MSYLQELDRLYDETNRRKAEEESNKENVRTTGKQSLRKVTTTNVLTMYQKSDTIHLAMNMFPTFFNTHLSEYLVTGAARPTYAILGCREWQFYREYVDWLDSQGQLSKTTKTQHVNPTFQEIQLLKSYEESVVIFVP